MLVAADGLESFDSHSDPDTDEERREKPEPGTLVTGHEGGALPPKVFPLTGHSRAQEWRVAPDSDLNIRQSAVVKKQTLGQYLCAK